MSWPFGKEKSGRHKTLSVRLPQEDWDYLDKLELETGFTKSAIIRAMIDMSNPNKSKEIAIQKLTNRLFKPVN